MMTLLFLSGVYQIYRKTTGKELKPVLILAEKVKAVVPTRFASKITTI